MQTRATSRLKVERRPRPALDARAERLFRQAVAHEMLLARESGRERGFDPNDARWKLAEETQRALQGTILAYEDRQRLLGLANKLGIRSFDANLILAVVQDRARRGESIELAAETIEMIPRDAASAGLAPSPAPATDRAAWLVVAVLIAMAADAALIAWLMFG
ncbi:MAG: hypothetical protein RIT24_37 [Planctomycetota bacterium]|jgi:hypothetical protein